MRPFSYARPATLEEARSLLSAAARPKGGGMDLLDLAKRGVSTPDLLVDLRGVPGLDEIRAGDDGTLRLGARATLARIATSAEVARSCPAIADAAADAATPQVRNVATLAGNLLQRPRCAYFRDPFFDCLKRGGKTCPSLEGEHREGAVFANALCCSVHASNLAPALIACGARIEILKGFADGKPEMRTAEAEGFFVRPDEDPLREARLEPAEVITSFVVPDARASAYVEVDQKQSFDWASASCAVALEMADGKVTAARVVLGAVAPIPWIARAASEALIGNALDEATLADVCASAVEGATPLRDNAHKVRLVKVVVRRALHRAAARAK